ncbi:hypothetical protein BCV69DRAFT_285600 [Microstroma glucosiphilum]|uniref:Uncharacterized protein n=1 Tax=Pseudomicrostroma glucosiphilum TaxID=1684307 RepID=A0A316TX96_9BASI|nr:hypothetical protein BCV69DRAFT_285600 [Pseudomicrostroma glucosiphilum]PWN18002.1 hypothetical protein BCV69DRAFT_285600 [Pseudomicrostroma glucosiphilum]
MRFTLLTLVVAFFLSASLAIAKPIDGEVVRRQSSDDAQINQFCKRFNAACVAVCTSDKRAGTTTKVVLSCEASGDWFNFGCKCGNIDKTNSAFNKLGGLTTTTKTSTKKVTTTSTAKPTVTKTKLVTSTGSATTTQMYSTTSTSHTTSTIKTTTTTTFLSVVPTTWVSTAVSVIPYTTQTTTDQTSASVQGLPIATTIPYNVIEVSLADPAASRRGLAPRAANALCRNFLDSCASECKRVSSVPKTQFCKRTSTTLYSYQLGCVCQNGMTETRHALADIEESVDIASTIQTLTSTATITRPTTTIQTITGYKTLTFLEELTSSFTITITTSTSTTSTSVTSTTYSPGTTTSTTTYNPIATKINTSTTLQVLSPTGALRVRRSYDDVAVGYVKTSDASGNPVQVDTSTGAKADADSYVLIKDSSSSGLYRLSRTDLDDGRDYSMVCELSSNTASTTFSTTSSNYCTLESLISQQTSAGAASMTPAGNFFQNSIETFNWFPQIGTISGMSGSQLKVYPQWINPSSPTKPATYLVAGGKNLFLTGDRADLAKDIGTNSPNAINVAPLYFAFES